jgi:hypothetical protein
MKRTVGLWLYHIAMFALATCVSGAEAPANSSAAPTNRINILFLMARLGLDAKRSQVRTELVELRDVLPTFLDAAGLPEPSAVEGLSLLDFLRNKPWRSVLDLEHGSCYAPKDGWVALMDQRYNYVYYTVTGTQKLFDLQADPHEMHDLAADSSSAGLVREWRQKMLKHVTPRGGPGCVMGTWWCSPSLSSSGPTALT